MFAYTNADEIGGLYHVGTLDISLKSTQSHEWNGLSVSNCPEAWKRICGCAGITWKMSPVGQDFFLLFHDLEDGDFEEIRAWAIQHGYFESDKEYRVHWYDEEYEEDRYFVFTGDEEQLAQDEYEEKLAEEYEGVLFEELDNGLKATPRLMELSLVNIEPAMHLDIAVMLYAEEVLGADGIWWEDRYDPYALSAPRGVIFNSHMSNFTSESTRNVSER